MKTRLTAVLCSAALLSAAILASCGGEAQTPENETEARSTAGAETGALSVIEEEQTPDFGGYTFRYLAQDNGLGIANRFINEMWVEKEDGDVINDAVFRRNSLLSEKLHIDITVIPADMPENLLKSAVMAGDDAYDMAGPYKGAAMNLTKEGLLRDWNDFDIDYGQPWWSSGARQKLQIMGRQYMMSGSILISEIDDTISMIYNKSMAENYDMPDIYDLVSGGKWTVDTFLSLCTQISGDLNGDSEMNAGEDLFGYIQDASSMSNNWFFACDLMNAEIGADGVYSFNVDMERTQKMFDQLAPFFLNQNVKTNINLYKGLDYFRDNKIFMYAIILRNLEMLRDMDLDFGVIPYPKLDEEQAHYINHVGNMSPILVIPETNTENDERMAVILETMAELSHELLIPAYYETALKGKIVRDPQSAEMLDIILASRTYDFSYIADSGLIYGCVGILKKGSVDFSSAWAKKETAALKTMQKIINDLIENE